MAVSREIYTIGHSTRPIGEFVEMLASRQIVEVADVRRFPGSRKNPQYGPEALPAALSEAGVSYRHYPDLGGRRALKRSSPSSNGGWRVAAFRAYADYTATPEWISAFRQLEANAEDRRVVVMCAEAMPWRCHRRLIADALVTRGWSVFNIMTVSRADPHVLPDFAQVDAEGRIVYPAVAE